MTEYWWLVAIPVLILALAPSMSSAASEWRTARAQRGAAAGGMASADSTPDLATDFLWIGIMLTAFLLIFQLRS